MKNKAVFLSVKQRLMFTVHIYFFLTWHNNLTMNQRLKYKNSFKHLKVWLFLIRHVQFVLTQKNKPKKKCGDLDVQKHPTV